jgi:hypothetical protein
VRTFALGQCHLETYPLVLLANEPCTYRSLLATELPFLRPNLRVLEIDPADLDATVAHLRPAVVICSRVLEKAPGCEFAILLLYPEGEDTLIRRVDGTDHALVSPRLSDVLGAIDHALLIP